MPNHVYNELEIRGDAKDISQFRKDVQSVRPEQDGTPAGRERKTKIVALSFERIFPTPPAFMEEGDERWYDWRIKNWDTKWDAYEVELHHDEEKYLLYTFQTAWSPAEGVFRRMGEFYPKLSFTLHYEEEAKMYPNGVIRVKGQKFVQKDLKS